MARTMNLDTRLIDIFVELCELRSVSRTAERLDLTQSTVSTCLARLREHYDDPLFVRTMNGMEPTPHALSLLPLLAEARHLLKVSTQLHASFDPASSDRRFTLCTSDIGMMVFIPALLAALRERAPAVRLDIMPIWGDLVHRLESGKSDLAVGYIPDLDAGILQQRLYTEHYVCCVASGHPRIGPSLSLADFVNEEHIVVTPSGPGRQALIKCLHDRGIDRKVGMRLANYAGINAVLGETEFIAVLPARLASFVTASCDARVLPLPFPAPTYPVAQFWHQRYSNDPGLQWLRALLAEFLHAYPA